MKQRKLWTCTFVAIGACNGGEFRAPAKPHMQSIERRVTPVLVAGGEASRVADDERLSAIADALVVDQDTGEIPQIIASVEVQSYIYYILPQAAIAKANVDLQSEAPDFETYQALVRERFPGGVDLIEEAKEILLDPTHSGGEGK